MGCTVHGILQARILEWVAFPFSRESSQPRDQTLQEDSLPAEPQGKPRNTGVGSLSLLQRIFLTQKSNWGLLHCRWILYQLSYLGSLRFGERQILGFPSSSVVKNLPAVQDTGFDPCIRKIPWGRKWHPTPVFLPEKSHGQRSLAGYSAWGHRELGKTS